MQNQTIPPHPHPHARPDLQRAHHVAIADGRASGPHGGFAGALATLGASDARTAAGPKQKQDEPEQPNTADGAAPDVTEKNTSPQISRKPSGAQNSVPIKATAPVGQGATCAAKSVAVPADLPVVLLGTKDAVPASGTPTPPVSPPVPPTAAAISKAPSVDRRGSATVPASIKGATPAGVGKDAAPDGMGKDAARAAIGGTADGVQALDPVASLEALPGETRKSQLAASHPAGSSPGNTVGAEAPDHPNDLAAPAPDATRPPDQTAGGPASASGAAAAFDSGSALLGTLAPIVDQAAQNRDSAGPGPGPGAPTHHAGDAGEAADILTHVSIAPAAHANEMAVHLATSELGPVEIRVEKHLDGTTSVTVSAERSDTLKAFSGDQGALRAALDQAGIDPNGRRVDFNLLPPPSGMMGSADQGRRDTRDDTDEDAGSGRSISARGASNFGSTGLGAKLTRAAAARLRSDSIINITA